MSLHATRAFPGAPTAVGEARCFVAAVLAEADVPDPSVVDLAQLAVSELASNAVEHAGSAFEVDLGVDDEVVVVRVHDASPRLPHRCHPGIDDLRGRGLMLVEAIARRWGADRNGAGKHVWCELPLRTAAGGGNADESGIRTRGR